MKKKIGCDDSKMMGDDISLSPSSPSSIDMTHLTLVDEVISRIPTVLLRIVFAYASLSSVVSPIASRWNAANSDDLEALIQELMQKATVDATYGKLLIELAYKDKRFQQYPGPDRLGRFFLSSLYGLVYHVLFEATFKEFCLTLRNIRPNLFSIDSPIYRPETSTEERINAIEVEAGKIKTWLDSQEENSGSQSDIIFKCQIKVVLTPGVIEGLRLIFNLPRERTHLRLSDSLALGPHVFSKSSKDFQRCCRELNLDKTPEGKLHSQRLPFSETHWQMLEKMSPREQTFLVRGLIMWRQDQMLNVFSHAKASSSKSTRDDKQPPRTYLEVLKQLSCGLEDFAKELVQEIKRMNQIRGKAWELLDHYPSKNAIFEENLEFIAKYMTVCNDDASPYKVVVEFLSATTDAILMLKRLHSTSAQSQELATLQMKCVIL